MAMNLSEKVKNLTTRQKVMAGVFILVILIVIWQLSGLFGGGSPAPVAPPLPPKTNMSAGSPTGGVPPGTPMMATPQQMQPQPAMLSKPPVQAQAPLSPREAELLKLQQETQAKYLSALNELQMLRVERELAETNQAIATAKLATITAEKNIVDLLAPPPPPTTATYAKGLAGGQAAPGEQPLSTTVAAPTDVTYTVISVSQLQYRWNAVLGFQGNLYNVTVGDVLPPDRSKVVRIDRSGVTLERNGARKRVSLVPII